MADLFTPEASTKQVHGNGNVERGLTKQLTQGIARMPEEFRFVQVNEFQPNADGWNTIGNVTHMIDDNDIILTNAQGYQVKVSFLSKTALRVRFRPIPNPVYDLNNSYTVVNRDLGQVSINVEGPFFEAQNGIPANTLKVRTGSLDVLIGLEPYGISVQKDGKVITEDTFGKNIVFSNQAIANLKKSPDNESYFGFGEKAGSTLDKKNFTLTFFNYDNFKYNDIDANGGKVVPENNEGGPLNPSSPLYNSMPFALAIGKGENTVEYAYGIYFDNVSQSYFNLGSNDYSDMTGKYYFGALYGELDYYILVGEEQGTQNVIGSVIEQYSRLTGKSTMPPMYALGYQQGCYGYYDRWILMSIAKAYRAARIPIDGLHIDVDFQNNYRTFTNSENKFPNVQEMFESLHELGFKCSTNITGIITANPLDENGEMTEYPTRDGVLNLDPTNAAKSTYKEDAPVHPFIYDTRQAQAPSPNIFIANENYGEDTGLNPFRYPSPSAPEGTDQLGTYGFYSDLGRDDVQRWWGEQYDYLLRMGLDMIWQDMTCPAVVPNFDNGNPDKTLPLNLMMYDKVTEEYQPNAKIHNAFALNLVQATFDGITKLKLSNSYETGDNGRPLYNYNKRNFIIARGGFAGVHRYAGIWTGDSASSWDFLQINIPEVLNVGLSGLPISGCDIGGFANGTGSEGDSQITNYELFTRWMTAGAFLPWYRNHYDGYTKEYQEPYRYGAPVPDNCRKYINIRYQLLQLFYDAMFENTQTGMPVCRAMFLQELDDLNVFNHADDQFFVGKDLLVAPMVTQDWNRDIYLPAGNKWYVFDIEGGALPQPTPGGQVYNWYVPLNLVPIYVREGGIIPVRLLEQYIGELAENPLNFYIYPGPESSYQLYQDDKTTMDAETKGEYRLTTVSTINGEGTKQVVFNRIYDKYTPDEKFFLISLLGNLVCPSKVSVNGKSSSRVSNLEDLDNSSKNVWYYDGSAQKVVAKVMDSAEQLTILANY